MGEIIYIKLEFCHSIKHTIDSAGEAGFPMLFEEPKIGAMIEVMDDETGC